jgi:hypothetical protein
MPFALLIIGVFLLISGVRSTQDSLFALVKADFSGTDNFIYWFVAILIIGAVGYVPKLKPISTAFLVLVIVVLFLKKGNASGVGGGFFAQLATGLGSTASASATTLTPLQQQQNVTSGLLGQLQQNLAQSISVDGMGLNAGLPQ